MGARSFVAELKRTLGQIDCPTCRKKVIVLNVGSYKQKQQTERVTAETHCTCVGGPAHHLVQPKA